MGIVITVFILLFIVGSIMGLKPSAHQKNLGLLREKARIAGLQPKLVPCPEWLINKSGDKGQGMVARYSVVITEATLPAVDALVIDNVITIVRGDITLAKDDCPLADILGISMQANFVAVYITESFGKSGHITTEDIATKIINIQKYLHVIAKKVQDS